MKQEDVRDILPGVLAGNGEDAKLIEWCKLHLKDVLKASGMHMWKPPYYGEVSDNPSYMNVFESSTHKKIGSVPISAFKSSIAICEVIKRNNQWYMLTADYDIKIYSLPDLKLIAQCDTSMGKIVDLWCPRLHCELKTIETSNETISYYSCRIDDNIANDAEWESMLFAFVECYDPFCSGSDYVCMLDLRNFTDGIIKSDFLMEKPSNINLRKSIDMENWTKSYPTMQLAMSECVSTIDRTSPSTRGWTSEQMDYFTWSGEIEDARTTRNRFKEAAIAWVNHPDCVFLSEKLGVTYQYDNYDYPDSAEQALELAESNPEQLKLYVLHTYRRGPVYNGCWAVEALARLEPCEEICQVLHYIAKNSRHEEWRKTAQKAIKTAYPQKLSQRLKDWCSRGDK